MFVLPKKILVRKHFSENKQMCELEFSNLGDKKNADVKIISEMHPIKKKLMLKQMGTSSSLRWGRQQRK